VFTEAHLALGPGDGGRDERLCVSPRSRIVLLFDGVTNRRRGGSAGSDPGGRESGRRSTAQSRLPAVPGHRLVAGFLRTSPRSSTCNRQDRQPAFHPRLPTQQIGIDGGPPARVRSRPSGSETGRYHQWTGCRAQPRSSRRPRQAPKLLSHLDEAELWPLVVNRERVAEHRGGEPALPRDREPPEGSASVAVSIRIAR
jgi:hypothetical protein